MIIPEVRLNLVDLYMISSFSRILLSRNTHLHPFNRRSRLIEALIQWQAKTRDSIGAEAQGGRGAKAGRS